MTSALTIPALALSLLGPQEPPRPQQQVPMPEPQALAEHRGEAKIIVDGTLVEWPSLPPIDLGDVRQLSGTPAGAWRGPADLSAQAFLMWDSEDLYVAAAVRDEWHRAIDQRTYTIAEIPPADSVVITFDPARDTRAVGPDPRRREDREFWLADIDSQGKEVVQWDRLRGTARIADGARLVVAHDKERGITTYEARIPWTQILPSSMKIEPGLVFDMQLVVNDYDESTDPMPQTRIGWTFGRGPAVDPGAFGAVMLVREFDRNRGMPEFPPRPVRDEDPVPGPKHWIELLNQLADAPAAVHDGSVAPQETGGLGRLRLLEEFEDHCERFPRLDLLEFCQRIHRRMSREVAGISARGLPFMWRYGLSKLSSQAAEPPEAGAFTVYRIPQGGWLVRSREANFLIDPAGVDIAHFLWGAVDFAIITQPLDMSRRNDQLLVRMAANKPPKVFMTHAAFHLPYVLMSEMPLVELGKTYDTIGGLKVAAIGNVRGDGSVPYSASYRVEWPDGKTLLVAAPGLAENDVPEGRIDALLLSARHERAAELGRALDSEFVLVDDLFLCQVRVGERRVSLASGFALQKALLPRSSIVLAPGESWTFAR